MPGRLKLALAGLLCLASLAGQAAQPVEPDGTTALQRAIYTGDVGVKRAG